MKPANSRHSSLILSFIIFSLLFSGSVHAAGPLLIAYGGHNETMAPLWVGIEKGLFRKHGLDPRVLQTRSGPIMMATLASGGAPLVWAAPSSALSATVGGMKLGCFAVARINPKVQEVDLNQLIISSGVRNLEESGFMTEKRKQFTQ